jgi:hypothetical protein
MKSETCIFWREEEDVLSNNCLLHYYIGGQVVSTRQRVVLSDGGKRAEGRAAKEKLASAFSASIGAYEKS